MDIPDCIRAEEIRLATLDSEQLSMLSEYALHDQPPTKAEQLKELQPY